MDPNILLFSIIAVLMICFFAGRRAGLIRSLIPVISSLASFILLAVAFPVVRSDITDSMTELQIKDAAISAAAFVVTFIILKWLIMKVLRFFRILRDAPVIGSADRMLGGIAGFIGGLLIIWGSFFFLLLFYGPDGLPVLFDAINKNEFVKLLYNNNLIMTLINYFVFAS